MCNELKYKKGGKVIAPHNFTKGGEVKPKHKNIPKALLKNKDPDTVFARLQAGEIVIPKKHVKKVAPMLKKAGIKLPNVK